MLAAETVTLSLGAIQWIVGLALAAAAGASGVLVARALHGRALAQLQEWKRGLVEAGLTAERWKEFREWQSKTDEKIDIFDREHYARTKIEEDRHRQASSSSTTRGTQPYPRGRG
jgi:hypothetical protein